MNVDDRGDALARTYIEIDPSGAGSARRIEVDLLTLTPERASCSVPRDVHLPCAVGDTLTLRLVHSRAHLDHAASARLVQRSDQRDRTTLGLEFTEPDAARGVLRPAFAYALDRRTAIRVRVEGSVTLVPPAREGRVALEVASLHDLSIGGLAADVGLAFEAATVDGSLVECVFRLPGVEEQLSVAGRIRHRTLLRSGRVRYGIEFADTGDGRLGKTREAVVAWLARGSGS